MNVAGVAGVAAGVTGSGMAGSGVNIGAGHRHDFFHNNMRKPAELIIDCLIIDFLSFAAAFDETAFL